MIPPGQISHISSPATPKVCHLATAAMRVLGKFVRVLWDMSPVFENYEHWLTFSRRSLRRIGGNSWTKSSNPSWSSSSPTLTWSSRTAMSGRQTCRSSRSICCNMYPSFSNGASCKVQSSVSRKAAANRGDCLGYWNGALESFKKPVAFCGALFEGIQAGKEKEEAHVVTWRLAPYPLPREIQGLITQSLAGRSLGLCADLTAKPTQLRSRLFLSNY